MKFPTIAVVAGLIQAQAALADIFYTAEVYQNPDNGNQWCLKFLISDIVQGVRRPSISQTNCNSFTYPGENQLAWDIPGLYDWYYAKIKAHHLHIREGLGVTYGTDHGTFYFDIPLTNRDGKFTGYGWEL